MPEPNHPPLSSTIADLSDPQAVRALALVADHQGLGPNPAAWAQAQEAHLSEAVADPAFAAYALATATLPSDGELARRTLSHLAAQGEASAQLVEQAADLATGPAERFELTTLAIGGLVVAALQTEVELERSPEGRWRFRLHKQPMRDSTLGRLLSTLIARFGPGGQ
jgi:hypothetical protein